MSGQQHAPAALYPRERHGTHSTGGWVGPRAGLDGGKSRPHQDSIPYRPAPSQSLYRLSYRAHNKRCVMNSINRRNLTGLHFLTLPWWAHLSPNIPDCSNSLRFYEYLVVMADVKVNLVNDQDKSPENHPHKELGCLWKSLKRTVGHQLRRPVFVGHRISKSFRRSQTATARRTKLWTRPYIVQKKSCVSYSTQSLECLNVHIVNSRELNLGA